MKVLALVLVFFLSSPSFTDLPILYVSGIVCGPDGTVSHPGCPGSVYSISDSETPRIDLPGIYMNGLRWSPDGSKLLIPSTSGLYLWDTAALTTLTNDERVSLANWSPDGSKIVYVVRHDLLADLFVMDMQDFSSTLLQEDINLMGQAVWFGDQILYTSVSSAGMTLYLITPQTTIALVQAEGIYYPTVHEDQILFSMTVDEVPYLYLWQDSELTQLTTFSSYIPEWSPDGSQIAFVEQNHENGVESFPALLHILDMATGEASVLTQKATIGGFTWSPDGNQIAYIGGERYNADLCLVDVPSGDETCSGVSPHWLGKPVWQPD